MEVLLFGLDNGAEMHIHNVINLFSSIKGIINFKSINVERDIKYRFEDVKRINQSQIISLCNEVRDKFDLNDYVVMVTLKGLDIPIHNFPKEKDWNSVFIHRNIAVNCSSRWNSITNGNIYLAVAHQIVENIFQAISHMELNSQKQLENVHQETEICINDYCADIQETKGKIRSGYICQTCKDNAIRLNDFRYIEHIENLLTEISNKLRYNSNHSPTKAQMTVTFDDELNMKVGDNIVDFKKSKISKVNYFFHLINYDIPLTGKLMKDDRVKEKFLELASLLDHDMTDANYNSHLKNLRCNHNRSNDVIVEHCKSDVLSSMFKIKSSVEEQDLYSYKISSLNNNIQLHKKFQRFRIDR